MDQGADGRFVAIDFETTGLHALCDRVVEVGAARFDLDGVQETFESLVHPGRPIPPDATALHGITDGDVATAPSFDEVCIALLPFLEGAALVAHNAPFDASFLLCECDRAHVAAPPLAAFDSCALARVAFPDLARYSLDHLTAVLSLDRSRGHRALPDALASADLFLRSLRALGIDTPARLAARTGGPVPLGDLGFRPSPELPPSFAAIGRALSGGETVRIVYEDRFGNRSDRKIVPLRLAAVRGSYHMEAHCLLRGETRCFRLDRIRAIDGEAVGGIADAP